MFLGSTIFTQFLYVTSTSLLTSPTSLFVNENLSYLVEDGCINLWKFQHLDYVGSGPCGCPLLYKLLILCCFFCIINNFVLYPESFEYHVMKLLLNLLENVDFRLSQQSVGQLGSGREPCPPSVGCSTKVSRFPTFAVPFRSVPHACCPRARLGPGVVCVECGSQTFGLKCVL